MKLHHPEMDIPRLPPEIIIHIIGYLEITAKNNFRLVSHGMKNLVDEPLIWKDIYVKLNHVDTKNKKFWKTLQARQIRYLDVSRSLCSKTLSPKHYEIILKSLKSSLIRLETLCTFIHMDHHVLKQLCIGNLEELILHCGHTVLPCDGCETSNLRRFSRLKRLILHNVTTAYLQHFSKGLSRVVLPSVETLHIGTGQMNVLHVGSELAVALHRQSTLQEVCLPKYTVVADSFFTTYADICTGSGTSALSSIKLLGLCDIVPLRQMLTSMRSTLCKLSICVNAENASTLMPVLSQLSGLTDLGLKFESIPLQPGFYCLHSLPATLTGLSLAFEITHTPTHPPFGQKLLQSGSKWFPHGVLPSLPRSMWSKLCYLWLASVKLAPVDLDVLSESTRLTTLTCSFMGNMRNLEPAKVCNAPKLRILNLHSMKCNGDLRVFKKQLCANSKDRIQVFACPKNVFNLPSYIPQHSSHDVQFTVV